MRFRFELCWLAIPGLLACSNGSSAPAASPGRAVTASASPSSSPNYKLGQAVKADLVTLTVTKVETTGEPGPSKLGGHWLLVWMTVENGREQPLQIENSQFFIRDDSGINYHAYFCCFNQTTLAQAPILAHDKVSAPLYFDAPPGHLRLLWASKPALIDLGTF